MAGRFGSESVAGMRRNMQQCHKVGMLDSGDELRTIFIPQISDETLPGGIRRGYWKWKARNQ
jgi:hypothetical protein